MTNIIVAEEDKLRTIVQEELSKPFSTRQEPKTEIDTITLTNALALLLEHGYPMSKAKLYKLTSSGSIPCRKFGQKIGGDSVIPNKFDYTRLAQSFFTFPLHYH